MTTNRRSFIREALASSFVATVCSAMPLFANAESLSPVEARQIAEDAYVYGYSLVTTEVTRVQGANVSKVETGKLSAPMNQFANVPRYPPADYRGVSAPNADTLYSLVGSIFPNRWCSATPTLAAASICSRWWTFG
jgi:hypothetical protein